jgi:hypothetical protein
VLLLQHLPSLLALELCRSVPYSKPDQQANKPICAAAMSMDFGSRRVVPLLSCLSPLLSSLTCWMARFCLRAIYMLTATPMMNHRHGFFVYLTLLWRDVSRVDKRRHLGPSAMIGISKSAILSLPLPIIQASRSTTTAGSYHCGASNPMHSALLWVHVFVSSMYCAPSLRW